MDVEAGRAGVARRAGPWRGRGVAVAAALAATLLAWLLYPALHNGSVLMFLGAVAAVAIWAGLAPGLWCTVLSVAAIDFLFLTPHYSLALVAETDLLL